MRRLLTGLLFCLLAVPAGAAPVEVGGLTFTMPESWIAQTPASPMRKAQYEVPNPVGAPGVVTFFHFGAARGGTAQANIERWYRQFQEPRDYLDADVTRGTVGDLVVHRFRATGTFLSGRPGGPKTAMPDTTLRAAVFEGRDGNVFVRFVAPTGLSKAHADGFDQMVDSVTPR
ncbi:MAG: hypothetical protein RIM84_26440 [Alphaproteobacteria bacterium]